MHNCSATSLSSIPLARSVPEARSARVFDESDRRKNPHYPRALSRYKRQTYAVSRTPHFFSFLVCCVLLFFLPFVVAVTFVCVHEMDLPPNYGKERKNKNKTTYEFSRFTNSLSYPMVRACATTERSDFSVFFGFFIYCYRSKSTRNSRRKNK